MILASRFLRRKFDDVTFQGENDVTCQKKNDVIQQNKMAANVAADLILSAEQDNAYQLIRSGHNVAVLGHAGSGKTFFIRNWRMGELFMALIDL